MTEREARELIIWVFEKIHEAKSIQDLVEIENNPMIPGKNRINDSNYPGIDFKITPDEIQWMMDHRLIDNNYRFASGISSKITDPLTKVLFALAWKNGDLNKAKHIIRRIAESKSDCDNVQDGLVFYQFGKFLTKSAGQPIIDQHVIRAYWANQQVGNKEKFMEVRRFDTITVKQRDLLEEYKRWLISDNLTSSLRKQNDYSYHIDRILYAAGKTIKIKLSRS